MSGNYPAQGEKNLARIIQSIQDLFAGRNNAFGEFTLDVDPATTTVVSAPNCAPDSVPLLTPMTLNAAIEWASGDMYISDVSPGEFTVTHAASEDDDRTFRFFTAG